MSSDSSNASASASALSIFVHPLVVLSISDHSTRSFQQFHASRVLGLLFGQQNGRSVQVMETVESSYSMDSDGAVSINFTSLDADKKLFQTCYPDYECLGWYRTGGGVEESSDSRLHAEFKRYNERPLFIILNPADSEFSVSSVPRELPFHVFEEIIHVVGDKTSIDFVKSKYFLQADEGERLTLLHCAKLGHKKDGESELIPHYSALQRSIQSLNSRVEIILRYIEGVQSGAIQPADQEILREIKSIVNRLPVEKSDKFKSELNKEMNESLLISFIASVTSSVSDFSHLNYNFNQSISDSKKNLSEGGTGKGKRGAAAGGFDGDDRERMGAGGRSGMSQYFGFLGGK